MPVNSHVQMPASIMRGFFIKKMPKFTYSLDVFDDNHPIKPVEIKKHGTIYGYFEDKAEEMLAKGESDFGEVKKKILEVVKSGGEVDFSSDDKTIIKTFVTYTLTRLQQMPPMIQYNRLCRFFRDEISPSDPIYATACLYPRGNLVDSFNVSVLKNNSSVNLIAPENCIYETNTDNISSKGCLCFPITPKVALILCEMEIGNVEIDSDEVIKKLNEDALFSVYATNSVFMISSTIDELKNMIPITEDYQFQKKVFIMQFLSRLRVYHVEDWGDVFSDEEIEMVKDAYIANGLQNDIKIKFESFLRYLDRLAQGGNQ